MAAETVTRAVLTSVQAAETIQCVREPSFRDMYNALGNAEAQDVIRNATPGRRHCFLLKENPEACIRLHVDFEGDPPVRAGDPCPNNPLMDSANWDLFDRAEQTDGLADTALQLSHMARLHLIDRSTLMPTEFQAILAVERAQAQLQSASEDEQREPDRG